MPSLRTVLFISLISLISLSALSSSATATSVIAVTGQPFGVGQITIPVLPRDEGRVAETNGYLLSEPNDRVLYPAFTHRRALGLLRDLIGIQSNNGGSSLIVYFLFKGDEPLQLTVNTPAPQTIVVVPQHNPRQFQRMLRSWWQQYTSVSRLLEREGDYPPIVEMYLSSMLGGRLGLQTPLLSRTRTPPSLPKESLLLVLNVESMRLQAFDEFLNGQLDLGDADQPVPSGVNWSVRTPPAVAESTSIEPIAEHVPEECFYARFGSFDNYLWMRKFTEQNGGSANRLVTLRGHDMMLNQKLQDQLGLKETALSELFGNTVISDVALLGRDTYLREGAAIGILFEARGGLLKNELMGQRREALNRWKASGATMTEVTVGDHEVSFASTPGNEFRSFYAVSGDYHLVTNSQAIVRRFFEASQGIGSLAQSNDFRQARSQFPIHDNDALFAYLSPAFFRGLMSPQYQIELRRRLRAVTELEIFDLASLVAKHEQLPYQSVDELIQGSLVPDYFCRRPDASQIVLVDDQPRDSLRGSRGSFLPIPDVPIDAATVEEVNRYATMASFHESRWSDMDPLVLQLRRTPIANTDRERLDIRAEMLPFERRKYGWATSIIGPPTTQSIRQSSGDAITAQLILQGGMLRPNIEPHHVFFGIRDEELPIEFSDVSLVRIMQVLRSAPAYLGVWPKLGIVDLLPLRTAPVPDDNGFARLPFGLWQLSTPNDFSLVGVNPEVLANASTDLDVEESDTTAQLRIHVTDVSESKIQTWFAALDFQRAYKTSVGNTHLLHSMRQQLGVDPSEARALTEELLGAKLICALDGEYQLYETDQGFTYWGSNNWPHLRAETEEGGQFASPLMAWFRGLDVEVQLLGDRISAQAELDVKKLEGEKFKLPFFNLLRGK